MIPGETELNHMYPFDVPYNGVRIGQYFFHNMRITDPQVVKQCEEQALCRIHVKQGYTCCSTAAIRENLVITAEAGIAEALKQMATIKVLHIPPQKEIQLPGLDYGFIGGATGRIDDTHFVMAGHIKHLENGEEIQGFLQENGVQLICLTDEKPIDLGTMLFFTL